MPKQNSFVTREYFDQVLKQKFDTVDNKFDAVMEKLDKIAGTYQGHEEEHTLLNNTVSEHSDNLEVINQKLGIVI